MSTFAEIRTRHWRSRNEGGKGSLSCRVLELCVAHISIECQWHETKSFKGRVEAGGSHVEARVGRVQLFLRFYICTHDLTVKRSVWVGFFRRVFQLLRSESFETFAQLFLGRVRPDAWIIF